jgi:S1-C subfamily serine protease
MKKFIVLFIVLFPFLVYADILRGVEAHNKYLYPIVRITAEGSVGSGTIVYSKKNDKNYFSTYILTNYHVINNAIKIKEEWNSSLQENVKREQRSLIYVEIFQYQKVSIPVGTMKVEADIVVYNEQEDMALVKLRYEKKMEYVAELPKKDNTSFYKVFDESVAVGCSLGWPPIPTHGEITRLNFQMDSLPYDMSSAQIIFGNSGGAMFTKDGVFIGIPSRVAIVGWSNAVAHMGFFIPVKRIYVWFEKEFYDFIFDSEKKEESCLFEREKYIELKKKNELQ